MTHVNRIIRYAFHERLMHTLNGLSYVYLLLTGLAFWTPALYWLATVLGGGYLSRLMHPWIGLVFAVTLLWMFFTWHDDMRVTPEDIAWRKAIKHYVKNEDEEVPPVWRFNYGQKQFFWIMVGAGLTLLLSGLVMWYVASIPRNLMVIRTIATLIHAVAALVTIGGFIVHLYMGLAVVPGGLRAVINGDVTAEWAEEHHPLWAEQMRTGAPPRPSAARPVRDAG
jgi:formate dehydrogenase subunit gamma